MGQNPPPGGTPPPGSPPPPPGGPPGGYAPPPQQPGGMPPPPPSQQPGGYTPPPPPPGGYAPPPGGYPMQQPGMAMGVRYGGFWIRLVAYIIDALIIAVPAGIIGGVIGATRSSALSGLWNLIVTVAAIAYFIYLWGSRGQTIGMMPFNLRVVDANTGQSPIGYGKAAIRYIGLIISSIVCYIGLIWAAFDARKQGWHDKIAGTVVTQS